MRERVLEAQAQLAGVHAAVELDALLRLPLLGLLLREGVLRDRHVVPHRHARDAAVRERRPGRDVAVRDHAHRRVPLVLRRRAGLRRERRAVHGDRGGAENAVGGVEVRAKGVPVFEEARRLAEAGIKTGASGRNWAAVADKVTRPADWSELDEILWCDPQTSGGLMVSCRDSAVEDVLACFYEAGHDAARVIGRMEAGDAGVRVE